MSEKIYSEDKYGLTIGGSLNRHLVNFSYLPEIPSCCPKYSTGGGLGYFFSLFYSYEILKNLDIQSDLGFNSSNSKFLYEEIKPVRLGNDVKDGHFEHSIDLRINSIYFATTTYLKLIDNFRFGSGLWLGYSFAENVFQREKILKPQGIIYENGRTIRDEYSGDVPDFIPFRLAFTLNLDYQLPFGIMNAFHLIPRLSYYYDVMPIVKNYNWSTHYINFSLSVLHKPEKTQYELRKETIIEIDTLRINTKKVKDTVFVMGKTNTVIFTNFEKNLKISKEFIKRTDTIFLPQKPDLIAKIQTYAVYPDEPRRKIYSIKVTENFVRSVVPILPFIFFEKHSSRIDKKYEITEVDKEVFNYFDPVIFNRKIFKILAERIRKHPDSKVRLYGFSDKTTEKSDCQIARNRAIAVRDYFVNTFNLDSSIFEILTSERNCEPKNPTLSQNEDAYFENRRVEIEPENPAILVPHSIITSLNSPQADPPAIEFDPEGTSNANIEHWRLELLQNYSTLLTFTGNGQPKKIIHPVDSLLLGKLRTNEPLVAKLTVWNSGGDSAISLDSQKVERDTSDKILERYSVAIFKVSKDVLREIDKIGIREFAKKINNGDTISITGYTDYLGIPEENIQLSQRRADAVFNYLNKIVSEKKLKVTFDKCIGLADSKMPSNIHSYSTPEERYLCRTVQIEIKKGKE